MRILFGTVSTFLISLLSMTMTIIFHNASKGNAVCLLVLLSAQFLPYSISKYLICLNPYYYLSAFSNRLFENLKGLTNISFGTQNTLSGIQNAWLLVLYGGICILILLLVYKRREYSS